MTRPAKVSASATSLERLLSVEKLRHSPAPVAWRDFLALSEMFTDGVGQLSARLAALEARLAEAEGRTVTFKGVWSRGLTFPKNSLVTRNGSLWLALCAGAGVPGEDHDGWLQVSRAGRE